MLVYSSIPILKLNTEVQSNDSKFPTHLQVHSCFNENNKVTIQYCNIKITVDSSQLLMAINNAKVYEIHK